MPVQISMATAGVTYWLRANRSMHIFPARCRYTYPPALIFSLWARRLSCLSPVNSECFSLDLNGDGLADVACRDVWQHWQVRLSMGNAWSAPETVNVSSTAGTGIRTADLDGDGRDDLICQLNDTTWRVHLANGGITAPLLSNADPARYVDITSGISNPSNPVRLSLVDANADGQTDLVFSEASGRWHVRKRAGPRSDLLASVTDGLGNTWRPEYSPLATFAGYTHGGSDGADQYLMRGGALHVVSKYTANDGVGGEYTMSYAYTNGRMNRLGRGFLGFEKVRATDSRHAAAHGVSVYTETVYRQDFPYIGSPELVTTMRSDGRKISVLDPGWARKHACSRRAAIRLPITTWSS